MGKQHVGYARLKSALQEIMVKIDFCTFFSTLDMSETENEIKIV